MSPRPAPARRLPCDIPRTTGGAAPRPRVPPPAGLPPRTPPAGRERQRSSRRLLVLVGPSHLDERGAQPGLARAQGDAVGLGDLPGGPATEVGPGQEPPLR